MKTKTLTTAVVAMRNKLQPHFKDNSDTLLFDYDFYTRLESLAKKEREKSKEIVLSLSSTPDAEGTLVRTKQQLLVCKKSAPTKVFDLDTFIELAVKELKIDKHKLRELVPKAKIDGSVRKTYSVEQIDE